MYPLISPRDGTVSRAKDWSRAVTSIVGSSVPTAWAFRVADETDRRTRYAQADRDLRADRDIVDELGQRADEKPVPLVAAVESDLLPEQAGADANLDSRKASFLQGVFGHSLATCFAQLLPNESAIRRTFAVSDHSPEAPKFSRTQSMQPLMGSWTISGFFTIARDLYACPKRRATKFAMIFGNAPPCFATSIPAWTIPACESIWISSYRYAIATR